jgi:hypothetical protein
MTKREEFRLKRCPRLEPRDDSKEQQAKDGSHASMLSAEFRIDTVPVADRVFGKHNRS